VEFENYGLPKLIFEAWCKNCLEQEGINRIFILTAPGFGFISV
jgi:hypothetical protein